MNRNTLYALLAALAFIFAFGALAATGVIDSPLRSYMGGENGTSSAMCTREARVCADGSVVSRTGPSCEFTPCPSTVKDLMPTSTPTEETRPAPDEPQEITPPPDNDGAGTMCTMDAKQCPDGSYVGRTGPECQFVCPTTAPTSGTLSITGVVLIGPTCPVSQYPANDSCGDVPYEGQIMLTNTAGGEKYVVTTDASGRFAVTLTRGVYDVSRPEGGSPFPACGGKIEIIAAGAPVPISCDSGIR